MRAEKDSLERELSDLRYNLDEALRNHDERDRQAKEAEVNLEFLTDTVSKLDEKYAIALDLWKEGSINGREMAAKLAARASLMERFFNSRQFCVAFMLFMFLASNK